MSIINHAPITLKGNDADAVWNEINAYYNNYGCEKHHCPNLCMAFATWLKEHKLINEEIVKALDVNSADSLGSFYKKASLKLHPDKSSDLPSKYKKAFNCLVCFQTGKGVLNGLKKEPFQTETERNVFKPSLLFPHLGLHAMHSVRSFAYLCQLVPIKFNVIHNYRIGALGIKKPWAALKLYWYVKTMHEMVNKGLKLKQPFSALKDAYNKALNDDTADKHQYESLATTDDVFKDLLSWMIKAQLDPKPVDSRPHSWWYWLYKTQFGTLVITLALIALMHLPVLCFNPALGYLSYYLAGTVFAGALWLNGDERFQYQLKYCLMLMLSAVCLSADALVFELPYLSLALNFVALFLQLNVFYELALAYLLFSLINTFVLHKACGFGEVSFIPSSLLERIDQRIPSPKGVDHIFYDYHEAKTQSESISRIEFMSIFVPKLKENIKKDVRAQILEPQ